MKYHKLYKMWKEEIDWSEYDKYPDDPTDPDDEDRIQPEKIGLNDLNDIPHSLQRVEQILKDGDPDAAIRRIRAIKDIIEGIINSLGEQHDKI